ncbi:MAG: tetratricopeptide repeat protein [Verrucomicrobia bacterium]|nr:tetratricopeptide repeat protein [Verrucomicrobiota bacterium]
MLEEQLKQVCLALGYEPQEFLRSSSGTADLSVLARSVGHGEVVLRFSAASNKAPVAKPFDTQRWNTSRYSTYATGAHSAGSVGSLDEDADEKLLHEIALRWSLGVVAGGSHVNPVIEFGHCGKSIYQVRPYYPLTLYHLIEKQVSPNHGVLFRIVEQIWAALAFLHQGDVNQPHGAVTIHNVGFSSMRVVEAQVCLLDLQETAETRRAELKRKDFQDLGLLIYQLACALDKPVDAVDAALRCPNASWKQLGNQEKAWKALTQRLLDADSFPFGYDLAGSREQLLGPMLPPKSPYTLVAKPRPVEGEPPYQQAHQDGPGGPTALDYQGEIEPLLQAGDYLGAVRLAVMMPDDYQPREQVLAWGNLIADQAEDELGSNSDFLQGMEILANRGCQRAGLRLGKCLAKTSPAEALGWLGNAAEAGLAESYFYIAGIYEQGGDGVGEDSARALEFYQASLDYHNNTDLDVHYRMAALILREKPLHEKLPLAIQLLEQAHGKGHYKATDLLAQCCAQGVGIEADEKRAFQLFVDSWNRSKKCNENYYTSSNNLGVCFAIGFGIRKDPAMARHYFKQGEIAGHEASKKNLQALLQST